MLSAADTRLFYWINQHHTPFLDWVMWVASQGWSWAIVLVAAIFYLVFGPKTRQANVSKIKLSILLLLGIGLCFLLSDRISVLCFKDVFCRLRPCHALEGVRMFRTSCGGQYGFVSSHAANVFALSLFLSLWHKKEGKRRQPHFSIFNFQLSIFAWACLVGYSRPYLGKHYPGDVICGALLGLAVGVVVFLFVQWIDKLIDKKQSKKKSALS